MTMLRAGSATDTGKVRSNNQDASLVAASLFAVADGMGGHVAGEVAARVALDTFQARAEASVDGLMAAVRQANQAVLERAREQPELQGMGTTLCAIALVPAPGGGVAEQVAVVNVGDSRVYLFQDDDITQISEDHSLVEDMVRAGRLSPDEARTHPQKNILTRVLGNESGVDVDSWEVDPHEGDRFVLCSDGLFNEVSDEGIASVLRRLDDPDDAAHELVALALRGGGRDNVTVVVVDVVDVGGSSAATSAAATTSSALSSDPTTAVPRAAPSEGDPSPAWGSAPSRPARPSATPAPAPPTPDRHRRLTWRTAIFLVAVLAVLGAAAGAVVWFARGTYFVGVDDGDVAVFQGRPGGVLWIKPTLEERTSLALEDVPPARQEEVEDGKEQSSLDDARRYVSNLEDQAEARRAQTTTTTTSPPSSAP